MKREYIGMLSLLLSVGMVHNSFAAAAADDVEEQQETWEYRQMLARKQEEQKRIQENMTPEQEALGNSLCCAANYGDLEKVKKLLAQGAPLNYRDRFGMTPLHESLETDRRSFEIFDTLLQAGADVNAVILPSHQTPLYIVAGFKFDTKYAVALIRAQADVNIPDCKGVTPLMIAAHMKNRYVMNKLLEANASVNQQDCNGDTVLINIIKDYNFNLDCMLCLFFADIDLNMANNRGETALIEALKRCARFEVRALILCGADLNMREMESAIQSADTYDDYLLILMNKVIQHAVKKKEHAEELPVELEQHLPLPSNLREITLDYEQERESSVRRRVIDKERKRAERLSAELGHYLLSELCGITLDYEQNWEASARRRAAGTLQKKNKQQKEEASAVGAQAVSVRRESEAEEKETSEESFYESALSAAERIRNSREQQGLRSGEMPQPDSEGFFD